MGAEGMTTSMEAEQLAISKAGVPPASIEPALDSSKEGYPAGGIESELFIWMMVPLQER